MSKKDKSCLLMDNIINNYFWLALPQQKLAHSHEKRLCSCKKRKLIFFPTLLWKLCIPNSAVWFLHRAHLHTGPMQILKVAFKFLSYLTLFPFSEISLVFVLFRFFFSQIIIVFDTIWFTVSMHWLTFCINFMRLMVAIVITGTWMLNFWKRTFWKLIVYAKLPAQLKEKTTMHEAQAMNFKDVSLSCCGHSVLMQLTDHFIILFLAK